MTSALAVLAARIREFANSDSRFAFNPAWGEIAGGTGLLLAALRESSLFPAADSFALLSDCLAMLEQSGTQEKIAAYYSTVLRASNSAREQYALAQSARILRNAADLLRSAQSVNRSIAGALTSSSGNRVWEDWLRREGQLRAAMRVPIAGHCAGKGFLAELQLTPIQADSPIALEHPELALEPLGAQLLETVAAQASAKDVSFLWHIVIQDELEGQLAPLDGDSLGAALAVGVELMSRRLSYHPGCLLIGRVLEDQNLGRTGFEWAKLLRARDGGFARIGVAPDSELSNSQIEQIKPLMVRRLRTVREAFDFAAARKPIPYL